MDEFIGDLRLVLVIARKVVPELAAALDHELDVVLSLLYLDISEATALKDQEVPAESFAQFNSVKDRIMALGTRITDEYDRG